ncbi:peptide ABC transporter substrate-binding protein [Lactobacillus kefiranofaciens]|uniref:Oligopeptide transport system substrate-binding protein n=1 Tax=Lactobacillus kefiranofaciens TaxID=267818 RepID=A0ABY0MHM3_9LACO|nr:peptide ABC transporter substrate-binding protein [Lactobacillus kefiranofaciens]KRM20745.1 extracellular solute-binding protein, family 5 [Lactobacillus kefiranofaciens subsp. kefiranofaciens DSM 5016 = JCM 6985]QFQ68431.1 peptide ABC transporter substrate-binding protein [Lactobacillus kefiranofaciens subsp. kefiranofaciens]SDA67251.1 oligopeptide transport system substrate-binding protein [Lactobacillus kefiranofaciens]
MRKRNLAIVAIVGTCAMMMTACANRSISSTKQVLNWSENAELSTQDPSLTTDSTSFQAEVNTQEGLYRLDKKQKPKLALAKSEKTTNGGKTYTFDLRKNAKWSNGEPITADDFVYSLRRTLTPSTKSSMAFYLYQIKNAQEINSGKRKPITLGVKALGKHRLQIQLIRPVSYFKRLLAFPLFFPQNQRYEEKVGKKYGTAAKYNVFSGPFKMVGWTGNNRKFSLVKNKNYWDAKNVKLNRVNETISESATTSYNLYQSGQLDETYLSGQEVAANKNSKQFYQRPVSALQRLDFNMKKLRVFNNIHMRKAISLAINRQDLASVLKDGSKPAQGFVPSGMGKNPKTGEQFYREAYVKSGVESNLAQAKKELQTAYQQTGTKSLNVTLSTSDTDSGKQIGEFLQSNLERLPGVKISISTLPYTTLIKRQQSGNFDITVQTWKAILSDPINFLDVFESTSSYDNSGWKNTQYNKLLTQSEDKYGNQPVKRWANLVAAEKILMKQQATVPLVQLANPQLLKSKVKDVTFNPVGIPYDFKNVYLAN